MSAGKVEPHTVIWLRHDIPGHETCRIVSLDSGWRLEGVAVLAAAENACRLDYVVDCDPRWMTRSARVTGWVGDRTIDVVVERDEHSRWLLNGQHCSETDGCIDIDLNFSPSTNLLPIRRLNPELGSSAVVRAAWLRFPDFTLEPLEQSYTRVDHQVYQYESAGGRFTAHVSVDDTGMVIDYSNIWSREAGQVGAI